MSRYAAAFIILILSASAFAKPPNVVLVLTDDQAYGDVGCHGNPVLQTPNADRFAKQSVECSHFYVCPVCSPTRAGPTHIKSPPL